MSNRQEAISHLELSLDELRRKLANINGQLTELLSFKSKSPLAVFCPFVLISVGNLAGSHSTLNAFQQRKHRLLEQLRALTGLADCLPVGDDHRLSASTDAVPIDKLILPVFKYTIQIEIRYRHFGIEYEINFTLNQNRAHKLDFLAQLKSNGSLNCKY